MKRLLTATCLAALAVAAIVDARGRTTAQLTTTEGVVTHVFGDPSDFVVALDQKGRCGSGYFHIIRSSENFKEMVAVVLTAFSADKRVTFFVARCNGDRNIISHGYAAR